MLNNTNFIFKRSNININYFQNVLINKLAWPEILKMIQNR